MIHLSNLHRSNAAVWLTCLAFAALWDFLFWGYPVGVSAAIFAAALCLGLFARMPTLWRTRQGRVMAGLVLLAIAALVEEPTSLGILIALLAVGTLVLVGQRDISLMHDTVSAWLLRYLRLAFTLWFRVLRDNVIIARWLARHPQISRRVSRVTRAVAWWILPALAGLLFMGLFALANPVIERFFGSFSDYIDACLDWLGQLSFTRMMLWAMVITLTYGLLRHRHSRNGQVRTPPVVGGLVDPEAAHMDWLTGPQMIVRLLLVMNVVFALENVLDAAYLYGGVPLPPRISYTDYAHRGAYTLIVTALLAGVFTLAAFRQNGTAHRSRACRWLVYAWIGQNILLLISTIRRVWLYVDMFQLTRLRLSTMIWCGLVAMGFVWIILRIKYARPNAWLWRMNAFTTAGLLMACAFINFDGIIASYNVRHCAEAGGHGQPLDVTYLEHLGPQALPALEWISEHQHGMNSATAARTNELVRDFRHELAGELHDWRSWTFRRQRAAAGGVAPAAVRVAQD